jgi:chemotaxis protein methyltransferase CheR
VNPSLAGLAEFVRRQTGITLPPAREHALRAALRRVAPGLDQTGYLAAAADPVHGPALVERLIDEVTVQETSFARDPGHQGQRMRVWSAGCATGEEAYTLALLAADVFGPGQPPVDVLGTDISGAALAAAVAGRYTKRSVRGLATGQRHRYLAQQPDGGYQVTGQLRELVRFRRHNLSSDPIPPPGEAPFDLIVCRNVLIYFDGTLITRITGQLERSLRQGGVLVLGATDAVARTAALGIHRRPPASPGAERAARRPPAASRPRAAASSMREQRLPAALEAAGKGDRDEALALVAALLADDPLDADAHFVQGLVRLEAGEPGRAAEALRRALYTDPTFALAAFTLGRAFDALGERAAARRAYGQALRSIDPGDQRHEPMLQQVGLGDIAAACRARLKERT